MREKGTNYKKMVLTVYLFKASIAEVNLHDRLFKIRAKTWDLTLLKKEYSTEQNGYAEDSGGFKTVISEVTYNIKTKEIQHTLVYTRIEAEGQTLYDSLHQKSINAQTLVHPLSS